MPAENSSVMPPFPHDQVPRRFTLVPEPVPPPPDYYQTLEVDPRAAPAVIAAAFRVLLRARHPDVNADALADEATRLLLDAYRTLSNPTRRAAYDAELRRRAARLTDLDRVLAPLRLDGRRGQLADDLAACAQDYDRLWAELDGRGERRAAVRLDRLGDRCRTLLRELQTLLETFDEAAAQVIVPSGAGGAVGGYLAVLEDALLRMADAGQRLLVALRREHPEEMVTAFAQFCAGVERDETALAPGRRTYEQALARARYVAVALSMP